jgi:arylsulfatase A-like enzyme
VTRQALSWLDGKAVPEGTPFFLFLHYMDAHDPFMNHKKPGVGYARAILKDDPDHSLNEPMREAYNTEIEYLDTYLGALVDGLKQRGVYDNTVIVFTADHGEEFLDHNGFWHGFTLYDEIQHIPLIIKEPKQQHAGEKNTDLARHIDIAPTLLQFAGIPAPTAMRGQAYGHNDFEGNLLHAVRTAGQKIITANPDNVRQLAPTELYDLAKDPKEKTNLAGDPAQATVKTELEQILLQVQSGNETATPAASAPISDAAKEQLNSLGYLDTGKK